MLSKLSEALAGITEVALLTSMMLIIPLSLNGHWFLFFQIILVIMNSTIICITNNVNQDTLLATNGWFINSSRSFDNTVYTGVICDLLWFAQRCVDVPISVASVRGIAFQQLHHKIYGFPGLYLEYCDTNDGTTLVLKFYY